MIKPGGTIGILGGGQLGRMLAMAAAQMGYRCIAYSPEKESVARDVCVDMFTNKWDDAQAMAAFAQQCDVVTWEFENVPVGPLSAIVDCLAPHPRALETAQDRLNEKRFAEGLGGKPAPYATIDSREDLIAAIDRIGTPGILKTRREGYDGKGQWRIMSSRDAEGVALPDAPCIYEGFVEFDDEFSVILARTATGETRFWDSPVNVHEAGMLHTSTLPSGPLIEGQVEEARALATQVADALNYVGVLTLEFFATAHGPVFNEMAPRVHNSGHWTVEGAVTSQFENHIRAICGLPLGDTRSVSPGMVMTNIVGKDALQAEQWLADPSTHLHLYSKAKARDGRKMGHATQLIWDT
ncbi:5-(carboxyamino)imidazole ribonucleotide synthase [Parerythrobacter jejuensis]|uniref:N5-carboxyaminoimidazole ribonucleotide synthase n=1 Tax=Parerythrobacter jejuensis TaxID=795812 RepID=A0A845AWP8_9SPHN|nr:5-(carboxyamino)imidazole ribonucleotide synthase [Parerythrobacter jejuensis]MXP30835.1 5-(carboxyamino)imidazole ribonucleotide synthase [Parerythrobacter jejuensis]MXP33595.1 5-(carboxyamino)imidazole ribonucleotide synthase [Parerythrobacter jejuensis]